ARDHPGVVLPLLDHRRGRRAGRRARARQALLLPAGGGVVKLESMYQEIILDPYRKPPHKGLREPFDAEVHHVNPTCGDEVTLRVKMSPNGVVTDVSHVGAGSSTSQAATPGVLA